MSADTQQLIQQSLQGDQHAFGQIVERYQGAVSAMAYSITGNLAQSEDLAQEAFIIAWKKLGALQKHESLSAWLCGIARNLARDWMRTQAARPTVSMEHLDETVQPLGESPEVTQHQRERADLVWTALAEIPENYREPLILFYRQGESIRDIAEALELSEDNVKQRLSRGRKLLRAEVARTVEDTLADTRPGKAFTLGVIAALPALYGAKVGATEVTTTSAKAAAAPAAMGALMKIALPVAVVLVLVLVGGLGWPLGLSPWNKPDAAISTADAEVGVGESNSVQEDRTAVLRSAATDVDSDGAAVAPTAAHSATVDGALSISGVTRFRDTGEPAPAMRVIAKDTGDVRHETISDADGRFSLSALSNGEYMLFAFDARHAEVPWEAARSKDLPVVIKADEPGQELGIEVPPLAGVLKGRITDKMTGKPLAGLQVVVMCMGAGGVPSGISDADGNYQVAGVQRGTSLVRLDDFNPVFSNDSPDYMESIVLGDDLAAKLDIAVDRGTPVSGHVVDELDQPVPEAWIDAVAFLSKGQNNWEDCQFKSGKKGEFTVWGAHAGDRVVVSARKDELESHIAMVTIETENSPPVLKLVLKPKSSVSGRFVDEQGRPVKASLWKRPIHPDGSGQWRGSPDAGTTFTLEVSQGQFEIKGQSKQHDFGTEALTQVITVGPEPLNNLTVTVASESELAGPFKLSGKVEDERGEPMQRCRVYIRGAKITNQGSFQETYTKEDGGFEFDGLLDDFYDVHATPGEPFEEFAGLDGINPAEASEVTIVAGRAPTLRGRVLEAANTEPLTRFDVEVGEFVVPDREFRWITEPVSVNSATGEFEIPARAGKAWYIRVSAEGYAPQRITGAPLTTGEQVSVAEITLSSSRAARGTVVDRDGNPVPDAQVYLHRGFAEGPRSLGKHVTETDTEGRFTVSSIPEEDEFLYFWKQDFAINRQPISDEIHAILTTGGTVEGRVSVGGVAPDGEFDVIAIIPDTHFVVSAEVGAEGNYRFDKLMKVGYRLQVTLGERTAPSTYYSSEELVVPRIGEAVTFDIDVPTGNGTIQGIVVDKGAAVAGAQLNCRSGHLSTRSSTGDDGAYRFENLPPGPVTISVYVPGEESTEANPYRIVFEAEISADEIIEQNLEWPN